MAKTIAAFYGIPSGLEKMNRIQQQIDLITRPLRDSQSDYTVLTKAMTAVVDSPAIQDITKISALCDSQSISVLYSARKMAAKMNTSEMIAVLQQYQSAINIAVPPNLQLLISEHLQEWSRVVSKDIPHQIGPLTEAKSEKLTRLISLTEDCTIKESVEEKHILSEDEQRIIVSEVKDILLSGENWEQCFVEQIKRFSLTHPVIAWVLEKIFFAILIGIITNIASSAIGQALSPANVYKEPNSSSQIVYHIELNQNVVVVGDVPYYYEVKIQDESTGHHYTGYVSKRSISLIGNEEKWTGLE